MTHWIILNEEDIAKIMSNDIVVSSDRNNGKTIICSEKTFKEHNMIWESEDEGVIEEVLKDDKVKSPHWIIDDHGFGGTYYKCSNCGAMHWDILEHVDTSGPCPYCDAPLHEGETVYMKDGVVEG